MKAKDLLKWIIDEFALERINPTGVDRIIYDADFDSETFFRAVMPKDMPFGDYLYIWDDCIGDLSLKELKSLADEIYELEVNGGKIYLVRIED